MTKKDIVRTIAEETGETQDLTRRIVQGTFDQIIETLIRDRRIELRNFGVFEIKTRSARRARNPDTGEDVMIPQRCVLTFKPGKIVAARIRDLPPGGVDDRSGRGPTDDSASAAPRLPADSNGDWDDD